MTAVLRPKTLRFRLMFSFLLLLVIPLAATALYGHVFARDILSMHAVDKSMSEVHLQAETIADSLRQAQGDGLYLTSLRSLGMLQQQQDSDQIAVWRTEVAQDFMILLSARPMYRALRYLDVDGMEVVAVESDGRTVTRRSNLTTRASAEYFQQVIGLPEQGVYVSSFGVDSENGTSAAPLIFYAMHGGNGGIIVIDIHAGWLLRNLPADLGEDIWALVDQDQRSLVYPEHFRPEQDRDDLAPMLNGETGSFETNHSVYVYDTVFPSSSRPDQFWAIYRETPKSILFAGLNTFYAAAGGFALVGVTLAVVLAFMVSRRLTKPIARLQEMTASFGQTGTAPESAVQLTDDEIGSLTKTFCEMAHELERKRKQEHRLIERLIRAQEEERKLIAYDLHDGLIQQLVGTRFYLSNCRDQCPIGEENTRSGIQRGCDALTSAIVEGRRIIEGLRPATLDDLGVTAAIEELTQSIAQAAGWELDLKIEALPKEPDTSTAVTLFRITQEALNNARRHAQAKHVHLHFHNGTGISIRIVDDGIGFRQTAVASEGRGLGMKTMQERAALLGGNCTITSTPGEGTQVDIWVPNGGMPNVTLFADMPEDVDRVMA
ncbi:MAG: HAMP domain-containing protein [Anaerolineae bacterium]|nr:HAMP domain-containing protein [Anaerolineae bacterium]